MTSSLVGSEMCIRDRFLSWTWLMPASHWFGVIQSRMKPRWLAARYVVLNVGVLSVAWWSLPSLWFGRRVACSFPASTEASWMTPLAAMGCLLYTSDAADDM
eukprot:9195344-Prorocentrum_lima.AAC.1